MVKFNSSMVESWKENGYQYILVLAREKYGVLRPLANDKLVRKGYTIEIGELNLILPASDYFLAKEKDAFQFAVSR